MSAALELALAALAEEAVEAEEAEAEEAEEAAAEAALFLSRSMRYSSIATCGGLG